MSSPDDKRPLPPETEPAPPGHVPRLPDKLRILVLSGPDKGKSIELERGTYLVGKAPECALSLTENTVSRQHLEIRVGHAGVELFDLQSKNGSFLNDSRFNRVVVSIGTVVRVGAVTELSFVSALSSRPPMLPSESDHFGALYGRSLAMRRLFAVLEHVAESDMTVLIEGETGTGKELCADALHRASKRKNGPFVVCDVAGIARTLAESELFGHVRGAFTGADRARQGAFEQANRGTLFIDELGELELEVQPRLLRAIEQRSVKPVGGDAYRPVDVRIVAATNRNLDEEVKAGRFREDLYHRLCVMKVSLPPLRERKEDIALLCDRQLADTGITLSDDALAVLVSYDWPGNVRELKNVVERATVLVDAKKTITPSVLELSVGEGGRKPDARMEGSFHEIKDRVVGEWEQRYLQDLLARAQGNVSKAAREGGIDRVYLHRLIKKHGIETK